MPRIMSVREFFAALIPDEKELDEFGVWAFGEDFKELEDLMKYLECWNFHHKKELELKPDDLVAESAPKMIMLWRSKK